MKKGDVKLQASKEREITKTLALVCPIIQPEEEVRSNVLGESSISIDCSSDKPEMELLDGTLAQNTVNKVADPYTRCRSCDCSDEINECFFIWTKVFERMICSKGSFDM